MLAVALKARPSVRVILPEILLRQKTYLGSLKYARTEILVALEVALSSSLKDLLHKLYGNRTIAGYRPSTNRYGLVSIAAPSRSLFCQVLLPSGPLRESSDFVRFPRTAARSLLTVFRTLLSSAHHGRQVAVLDRRNLRISSRNAIHIGCAGRNICAFRNQRGRRRQFDRSQ